MNIGGLQKLILTGFPGILACQVFLQGCNWRCPWCDAVEFVEKGKAKQEMPERHFFKFLKQSQRAFEGVVLSGGEPCLQKDLPQFCRRIKKLGFKIKLDTNGSFPYVIERLLNKKLVDYVALDIKAPKEKYAKAIGLEDESVHFILDKVEKTVNLLKKGSVDYEFCTTVTPLLHKQDIWQIAQWLKPAKRFRLQTFRPQHTLHPNFSVLNPMSESQMFGIQQAISPFIDEIIQ